MQIVFVSLFLNVGYALKLDLISVRLIFTPSNGDPAAIPKSFSEVFLAAALSLIITFPLLLTEAELLDCEAKSDSSLEREPMEDDSKGGDGGKKRKRKPYRPGRAPDRRRQLFWSVKWCSSWPALEL